MSRNKSFVFRYDTFKVVSKTHPRAGICPGKNEALASRSDFMDFPVFIKVLSVSGQVIARLLHTLGIRFAPYHRREVPMRIDTDGHYEKYSFGKFGKYVFHRKTKLH